ncbi:MAG: acyltransferase [Chitinophagaceae bacterium]|nr:MAG: acyltransferase [Chitinophagaceae bacterium]
MKADNKYVSYLDGFRGYAILLVVISHLYLAPMDVAFLGVTLFFFVSGLLITKLMIVEFNKIGTVKLGEFYIRRLLRLYPALLLMLIISIIVLLLNHYAIIWADIMAGLFYFTNYYLVYFHPPIPDENYLLVSKILWSLSVEEHFYLLFPLLFITFYSNNNNRLIFILSTLLVVFLGIRLMTYFTSAGGTETFQLTYYTTHCRADSILYGCVSALLLYKYDSKWYQALLRSQLVFILAFLVLLFTIVFNQLFFQTTIKYTLQGLAFAIIIPSFAVLHTKGFVHSLVDNKIMVYIGKLCYSLYLFHWVALKIGNLYLPPKSLSWYALVVILTIVLSVGSYYLVEKPFVKLRRKFGSNAKVATA